jgi:hypothetical protein
MSPSTQPVAQGTLASTPFAHLVMYIFQRRSSGTLVVQLTGSRSETHGQSERIKVLFHRGRAVAADVLATSDALDQALLPICARAEGTYEFFEDDLVGSGPSIVTGMFDPYAFVAEAARHHARPELVEQVLARFGNSLLCVQAGMDMERLSLSPAESRFTEALREGTATVGTLLENDELERDTARRLLYALLVTKVVGAFAPVADTPSASPKAPSGLPSSVTSSLPASGGRQLTADERRRQSSAAWSAIAARASQASRPLSGPLISSASPSSSAPGRSPSPLPGRSPLPPGTAANTNRSPTPSKPDHSHTPVGDGSAKPVRAVTPPGAFGAGSSPLPPGRAVSEPLPLPPSGPPRVTTPSRPVSRVTPRPNSEPVESLTNDGKFRRVLQLAQRGAFEEAVPIIRALVDQDRKNPAYLGLLASVLYGQGIEGTISKEIVETVNQALRLHPDEVHALYTKARCYKRMGKIREAIHYFRRTVTVDPGHLEAAREARLLLLRQNEKGKR